MTQLAKIRSFVDALQSGIQAFEEAGRILVELIDEDSKAKDKIMDQNPGITEDVLDTFERIGRKQLYYKLCINETPGFKALRRCPYSEQIKYASEPIELLITNKGKPETLLVAVHALTTPQAKQVFGTRRVRTQGEQRAWLESQKQKPAPIALITAPYAVSRGKVTIHSPCILSISDLARLLLEASE